MEPTLESCWICGGVANSREHKFLRAILATLYGRDGNNQEGDILGFVSNGGVRALQSPGSDHLKFRAPICEDCNTSRTQLSDYCFTFFWQNVATRFDNILATATIDLLEMVPPEIEKKLLVTEIKRYFAKLFGCTLCENNWRVPLEVSSFVRRDLDLCPIDFAFAINEDLFWFPSPWKFVVRSAPMLFSSGRSGPSYAWMLQFGPLRTYLLFHCDNFSGAEIWKSDASIQLTRQSFLSERERRAFAQLRHKGVKNVWLNPKWVTEAIVRTPVSKADTGCTMFLSEREVVCKK